MVWPVACHACPSRARVGCGVRAGVFGVSAAVGGWKGVGVRGWVCAGCGWGLAVPTHTSPCPPRRECLHMAPCLFGCLCWPAAWSCVRLALANPTVGVDALARGGVAACA